MSEIGLQGPEFTQAFVNPYGTTSLSPASVLSFASTPSGGQTSGTVSATLDLGVAALDFCEAELYVQCFIIRSDNTGSFSNRLRVDLDLDL